MDIIVNDCILRILFMKEKESSNRKEIGKSIEKL